MGAVVIGGRRRGDPCQHVNFRLNNSIVYGHDFAIAYSETFAEDTLNIEVDSSAYNSTRVAEYPGLGTPTFDVQNLVELNNVDPMFTNPLNGDYSLARRLTADRCRAGRPARTWLARVRRQPASL